MGASSQCHHPDVHIHVNHHRSGDTNLQYLEVSVKCEICNVDLVFRGLSPGMSPDRPMVSIDNKEIIIPIIGEGEEVTGKPFGYSISVKTDGDMP